ncbi:hypothetical protein RHMOL_Rhmol04G0229100 [Rhododendron molle]|uniref:Uncharacterized protein n=1 Tax=Rhododendron molle TaxID=49168 RepID=A0ACC0P4G3_RHOML|nr:hypothetical protein RHMOL_Rhmol04G0229100 [Rhododendron molle]
MALHAFITNAMGMFRLYLFIMSTSRRPKPRLELFPNPNFYQTHVNNINRLVKGNDTDCHDQLRVNRHTFLRLCFLVRGVGLGDSHNVCLEERVAIFLWVLGHHTKQRRTKYDFWRSIETGGMRWLQPCITIAMDNEVEEVEAPTKGKRRNWSSKEGDARIKCVVNELVGEKWRAENGFRGGFFNHVEKELEKFLPGTTLKANPHIDSKVKYWKVTWAKIVDIIALSGFGWDDVNKRIVVEKDVWENYEKAYPKKAKNMYGKTFPYFDDWQFMFGKDRATGAGVETPATMGRATNANQSLPTFNDCYIPQFGEDYGAFQNDLPMSPATPTTPTTPIPPTFTPHSSLPTSTPQTSVPQPNAGGTKRKRTRMRDEELSMFASMKNWMTSSNGHMEKMVNCFSYDKELSARRTQVPDELSKLDITLTEKFKLGAVICQEEQRVDNFYGIKPEERQAYVEAILSGVVYGPIY